MFRLKRETAGTANAKGRYSIWLPRTMLTSGRATSARNVSKRRTPPALCIHLPKPSPSIETATIVPTRPQLKSVMKSLLSAHKLAQGELGPLVDTPFERQHAIDIDDDHSQRQIEGDNRQQPEEELLVAELRSRPDPYRPDDEDYLREHQVCEAEFLWEDGAPLLDALFLAQDLSQRARSFRIFCHLDLP